jgi:hypothetical protein
LPVHEGGATNVRGFWATSIDGPFGGVAVLSGLVPRFGFDGGGSGSGGFGGFGSFGVFLAIALVLEGKWLSQDQFRAEKFIYF